MTAQKLFPAGIGSIGSNGLSLVRFYRSQSAHMAALVEICADPLTTACWSRSSDVDLILFLAPPHYNIGGERQLFA
jgi:hypothetical protein